MPAQTPRASFQPIPPNFDVKQLVESTNNFSYVDRISYDMIEQQGQAAFERLVTLHVVVGGKPLVIDGFDELLDPWTFSAKWLRDNAGDRPENARNLTNKDSLPLTMAHYLKNMGLLTNQFFDEPGAYAEKKRQRVYLKDIDCPEVWENKLKEHIPSSLFYLNDSTGEHGGLGSVPDPNSNVPGRRLGKGIARAGDLMSSLPPEMRAENLMCYIGHEGTYTPAHREMCASLGQNIMVEASKTVSDEGKAEKPGSSLWFMTESKDRHTVSEYWLSVLGHDIEVENHFAQVVAWKKAPFSVYVVEQRPGDLILIPPLAPHQVWNRGTRTMKVAWNRTTVETLEMAINEALPRSRIVCRDEQYKNKAIVYYTLQKYSSLLALAQQQASRMPADAADELLSKGKVRQLAKDFKRLFYLYRQILLSEMFNPEDRDNPKALEYLPFDSHVTCAYCRGNIFNRFLSCPSCKDLLGHHADNEDGDPYDVCLDCYAMGRSCGCLSNLKWVEQFRWKELSAKYESWRKLIIALEGGTTEKTPLPINEERKRYGKRTLAEVCKLQLKRRPFKDVVKPTKDAKSSESEEEIDMNDDGTVKKIKKKRSPAWLKSNHSCHVCLKRHPAWKMASCTTCDRWWCYGSLFRGWDKMPLEIMENPDFSCPHCLGICFAGSCRREGKGVPYEPKGTLLGHDTKKVADVRSVEALVDFSHSNLNWLKDNEEARTGETTRLKRARAEAQRAKEADPSLDDDEAHHEQPDGGVDQSRVDFEYSPGAEAIDPALGGAPPRQDPNIDPGLDDSDDAIAARLQQAMLPPPAAMVAGAPAHSAPEGYTPVGSAGYAPPAAQMYQQGEDGEYSYPEPYQRPQSIEPTGDDGNANGRKRSRQANEDDDYGDEDMVMSFKPKPKKPRLAVAGFRSTDLADGATASNKAKSEAQRQFEKEKERKAVDKAKAEGRFIMLQARLKGKRRIVQLKVPGARLAQLLAQQAARAALEGDDTAEPVAEREAEQGAAQQHPGNDANGEEEDGSLLLLKSDIAPKKPKETGPSAYEQKQRDGFILTSKTKKAMIPVERDENYGYRIKTSKQVQLAPAEKRRQPRRSNVDYEEIDVGSDEDEQTENFLSQSMNGASAKTSGGASRRAMPSYLQNKHAADDDLPDELPDGYRDQDSHDRRERRKELKLARLAAAGEASPNNQGHSTTSGKRPSMRPATTTSNTQNDDDDQFMDIEEAMSQPPAPHSLPNKHKKGTINGTFAPAASASSTASPAKAKPSPATAPSGKRPRGRPRKSGNLQPAAPATSTSSAPRVQDEQEKNRLAKLELLNGGGAMVISSGESSSSEGEDEEGMDSVRA
ncbi:hypothetical protein MBLNU230_g6338t1 [Neophaeotheca triangularis]